MCLFLGQQSVFHACFPFLIWSFVWIYLHLNFIYAIGTCPHFIATTTKTKPVIQLLHAQMNPKEDLNAAHLSCLIARLLLEINKWASDALMMQMLQVLARDSMGLWFVWLTQLEMIQRWWMRPSFSGDPERWGWQKGYLRYGWLQLTGWPNFASCGWMSIAKIKTKGHFTSLMMTV